MMGMAGCWQTWNGLGWGDQLAGHFLSSSSLILACFVVVAQAQERKPRFLKSEIPNSSLPKIVLRYTIKREILKDPVCPSSISSQEMSCKSTRSVTTGDPHQNSRYSGRPVHLYLCVCGFITSVGLCICHITGKMQYSSIHTNVLFITVPAFLDTPPSHPGP